MAAPAYRCNACILPLLSVPMKAVVSLAIYWVSEAMPSCPTSMEATVQAIAIAREECFFAFSSIGSDCLSAFHESGNLVPLFGSTDFFVSRVVFFYPCQYVLAQ